MLRDEVETKILKVFSDRFEIEPKGLDEDLREVYEFDSIDAIELLREIELLLETGLTREEKKRAMDIRTLNQIVDYVLALSASRTR
jgi:acyl carrier protein